MLGEIFCPIQSKENIVTYCSFSSNQQRVFNASIRRFFFDLLDQLVHKIQLYFLKIH